MASRVLFFVCVALISTLGLFWTKSIILFLGLFAIGFLADFRRKNRRFPRPDLWFSLPVVVLTVWGAVGLLWSINPTATLGREVRLIAAFALMLLIFTAQTPAFVAAAAPRLPRFMAIGFCLAAALIIFDSCSDFLLYRSYRGIPTPSWETVYRNTSVHNRGVGVMLLLSWPVAAFAWREGRKAQVRLLAAAVFATCLLGFSSASLLGASVGLVVCGAAALWSARRVAQGLAVAVLAMALLSPTILPVLRETPDVYNRLPSSAQHRLDIYDVIAKRIRERPLSGWGLESSRYLPFSQEEAASYSILGKLGRLPTHPHNIYLQSWVELGIPGLICLVGVIVLALLRIKRLDRQFQPFALGAAGAALVVGATSFSLWSDSWLGGLILTALLFFVWRRPPAVA